MESSLVERSIKSWDDFWLKNQEIEGGEAFGSISHFNLKEIFSFTLNIFCIGDRIFGGARIII